MDQHKVHSDADCCGANRNDNELKEDSIDRTVIKDTQKASGELVLNLQRSGLAGDRGDRRD